MKILQVALLFVHAFVLSRLVNGASVDRYESERPQSQKHTDVNKLLDVLNMDRRTEESNHLEDPVAADDEEYYYDNHFEDEEYEEGSSSDNGIELPRVEFLRNPNEPSSILEAERSEGQRTKGQRKVKGKGRKRNPCLKKYKDYCIHGSCQYVKELKAPTCRCLPSYSGERCHLFTLASEGRVAGGYNRTTALAVVAVVLSSLCLTIIGLLLVLRFHKRGAYDVENEKKVKLGSAPNH